VSVLSRKQASQANGIRGRAMHAAQVAVPMAKDATATAAQQAVPLAKSAGTAVKQGADEAVAWATPLVHSARSWAAPRLEESAVAFSEKMAPRISGALVRLAHKIDVSQQKSGRVRRAIMVGGSTLLTAAAGAVALLVIRRRQELNGHSANGQADTADTAARPASGAGGDVDGYQHVN
jgi:hypothetical protein